MIIQTSDLCDEYGDQVRVADPVFQDFGGRTSFAGVIATVKVFEDNILVHQMLKQPGNGRVLVIDGGGSLHCALIGDQVISLAHQNGWVGVVINGAVRDAETLAVIKLGVKALAACPRKPGKTGAGESEIPVTFAGVTFTPGEWLAADRDGVIVSHQPLA